MLAQDSFLLYISTLHFEIVVEMIHCLIHALFVYVSVTNLYIFTAASSCLLAVTLRPLTGPTTSFETSHLDFSNEHSHLHKSISHNINKHTHRTHHGTRSVDRSRGQAFFGQIHDVE
jgi:hypothetical protein